MPTRCFRAIVCLLPALAAKAPVRAADQSLPSQSVRLAYVPIMRFAAAYVAEERGILRKYGLKLEFLPVNSGTSIT